MFATLNRILCRTGGPRAFFGCVYLLISPDGSFTGSVAGHPPVLRLDAGGEIRGRIGKGAYPLGIKTPLEWEIVSGRIEPGDSAPDPLRRPFGGPRLLGCRVRRRAAGRLDPARRLPARAASSSTLLVADLLAFCGRETPEDDVSLAAIKSVRSA